MCAAPDSWREPRSCSRSMGSWRWRCECSPSRGSCTCAWCSLSASTTPRIRPGHQHRHRICVRRRPSHAEASGGGRLADRGEDRSFERALVTSLIVPLREAYLPDPSRILRQDRVRVERHGVRDPRSATTRPRSSCAFVSSRTLFRRRARMSSPVLLDEWHGDRREQGGQLGLFADDIRAALVPSGQSRLIALGR